MPGTIILLNGTSSSGKTSIVKALQDSLEEPYLVMGIDRFIWMLPKRYLNSPLWDEVLGLLTEPGRRGLHYSQGCIMPSLQPLKGAIT